MNRAELKERKESFLAKFNELLKEYEDIVSFDSDVHFEQCYEWCEDEYHNFTVDFRNIKTDEDVTEKEAKLEEAIRRKKERMKTLVDTYEGKKAVYKGITYCNIHLIDNMHFQGNVVTVKDGKEHISRNKQMRKIYDFSKLEVTL